MIFVSLFGFGVFHVVFGNVLNFSFKMSLNTVAIIMSKEKIPFHFPKKSDFGISKEWFH